MQLPVKNIYLYTAIRGLKSANPVCMYAIEDDATKDTKAYRRVFDRPLTGNQLSLSAALAAVGRISSRCEIHLYSDSVYLASPIKNGWLNDWKKNGWKNAKGQDVANRELWQQLYSCMDIHVIYVDFNNTSSVYRWMEWRMHHVGDGAGNGDAQAERTC